MNVLKIISLAFFFSFAKAQDTISINSTIINYDSLSMMLDYGCQQIGARYQIGAMGNDRFDCSGLVNYVASKYGYMLPRSSSDMSKIGVYVEADSLRTGDLIFFQGRNFGSVGHVAIVSDVRNGEIYILHATTQRGVIEEVLQKNKYFMSRWLFNKRVF